MGKEVMEPGSVTFLEYAIVLTCLWTCVWVVDLLSGTHCLKFDSPT